MAVAISRQIVLVGTSLRSPQGASALRDDMLLKNVVVARPPAAVAIRPVYLWYSFCRS